MSEETTKPPADKAAEAPAEESIPQGEYGKRLEAKGLKVTALGPDAAGVEQLDVSHAALLDVARYLRDHEKFDLLLSCSGVDWKTHRESVYHLYSLNTHEYVILKVKADANEHSPSLMPVYPAVDWHEREAYDLYGIHYDGHPDLRRILMPADWLGHPLRKDYKVNDPRLVWNER